MTDPLRASLSEQVGRMREAPEDSLPEALLDIVSEEVDLPRGAVSVIRPRDWDELRHQEGAEGRSAPYWAIAWPSGRALAAAVDERDLSGARVLELGCGLALPSIAAARAGGAVTATDGSPDAVAFAAHNLALNGVEGEVALADWRDAPALAEGAPWDLVLAADVLYLRHNVEALLRVLPDLVAPGGEAFLADPDRSGARDFLAAARASFTLTSTRSPRDEKVALHELRPRHTS